MLELFWESIFKTNKPKHLDEFQKSDFFANGTENIIELGWTKMLASALHESGKNPLSIRTFPRKIWRWR